MQAFSGMQRNFTHQNRIDGLLYLFVFVIYESMSGTYLLLPPLFSILLLLFANTLKRKDTFGLVLVGIALLFFEAQKNYTAFSSVVYALLLYKLVITRLTSFTKCESCIKAVIVGLSYPGFFIFSWFLSQVFILPLPDIDYYVAYYMVFEFVVLLLFIPLDMS
jgi:hypothetical protein